MSVYAIQNVVSLVIVCNMTLTHIEWIMKKKTRLNLWLVAFHLLSSKEKRGLDLFGIYLYRVYGVRRTLYVWCVCDVDQFTFFIATQRREHSSKHGITCHRDYSEYRTKTHRPEKGAPQCHLQWLHYTWFLYAPREWLRFNRNYGTTCKHRVLALNLSFFQFSGDYSGALSTHYTFNLF